jgi:hypothetical protein
MNAATLGNNHFGSPGILGLIPHRHPAAGRQEEFAGRNSKA